VCVCLCVCVCVCVCLEYISMRTVVVMPRKKYNEKKRAPAGRKHFLAFIRKSQSPATFTIFIHY